MGVVYGAYDPELDRKIALKLLGGSQSAEDEVARARLLREAKAMARLAHPNVVVVHDVGVYGGQIFLAMEFLGGGTLRSWLTSARRSPRDVLKVFVAAGRGLMAAHAAGLVHRDFKPENVLLDKEGRPRVVDFGLARDANLVEQDSGDAAAVAATVSALLDPSSSPGHLDTLTRTGAVMGTPAYMAPEQIVGEATTERTDQFSFCVALHEALYGERPFGGDSLLRLLHNVTRGNLAPVPEDHEVPAWIRRALVRGLRSEPRERWPSMAALIVALEDDPAGRHRRWLFLGLGLAVVLATLLVGGQTVRHRQQNLTRQISARQQAAAQASLQGRSRAAALRDLRQRAFAAFDGRDRVQGEALWRRALAAVVEVEGAYDHAEQAYEAALVLDPDRADLRGQLADVLLEDRLLADELRRADRVRALDARLDRYDDDGIRRRALEAPGAVSIDVDPRAAALALERFRRDPVTGARTAGPAGPLRPGGALTSVPPGSYRLKASAPGFADVVYPFEVARGESRALQLALLPRTAVPTGFVYVAAGAFWFGDGDEQLRTQFLDTAPLHRRATDGYFIARNEVTYREWIAFLEATPPGERIELSPRASAPTRGSVRLREEASGWQLTFQPATQRYSARAGEPIVYAGRKTLARQDWLDFPVSGVSAQDARRYLAWLRATSRVPNARLCTELEWERAARGADDRVYPSGDQLRPQDANFDLTYGRLGSAYGPDVVGSHPATRSPFGVDDLVGNVLELVVSSLGSEDELLIRGGAYFFGAASCRSTNREIVPVTLRDSTMGFRVCATPEEVP